MATDPTDTSYEERVAAQLAALLASGEPIPRETPRHPATGCPCVDCTRRDDRLEEIAEDRAWQREHGYDY